MALLNMRFALLKTRDKMSFRCLMNSAHDNWVNMKTAFIPLRSWLQTQSWDVNEIMPNVAKCFCTDEELNTLSHIPPLRHCLQLTNQHLTFSCIKRVCNLSGRVGARSPSHSCQFPLWSWATSFTVIDKRECLGSNKLVYLKLL